MSGQKWDDTDKEHYRWLPFTPQQLLPKSALFEETQAELQRININAWKYTPNSKCYFLQWIPSAAKTTFGECLLPAHWDRTDQSLPAGCKGGWRWLAQFERSFVFSSVFRYLQVLHSALLPLPVFRIPFPFTFYYLYNENEQLVFIVQNSITYNSVNRSICARDVLWIHLEKADFSNLALLIRHTSVLLILILPLFFRYFLGSSFFIFKKTAYFKFIVTSNFNLLAINNFLFGRYSVLIAKMREKRWTTLLFLNSKQGN